MSVMKSSTSFCIIVMITVRSSPAQHSVHTGSFVLLIPALASQNSYIYASHFIHGKINVQ